MSCFTGNESITENDVDSKKKKGHFFKVMDYVGQPNNIIFLVYLKVQVASKKIFGL